MEITSMDMPIELERKLDMENELTVLRNKRDFIESVGVENHWASNYKLINSDIEWLERELMVGVTGFEPVTTWTQTMHSTRLNYTPSFVYPKSFKKFIQIVFFKMFKNNLLRYYIIFNTKVNKVLI